MQDPTFKKSSDNDTAGLRRRVFAVIEEAILNGKYLPGESLTESRLAGELGVSRTPIREALTQLEREGLVQLIPNKGALVTGISQKDIQDIYAIRMLIEGLAARWAAENISADELRELQEAIDLEEFYTTRGDIGRLMNLDSSFHQVIYRASKSRPLQYMLHTFHHYIQCARSQSIAAPGRAEQALAEHKAVLQAIRERDGEKAESLTAEHIRNASLNLLKTLAAEKG
ncbi:MAG: GntR family transcriptional regulator [Proteobacteria bacterium]|nr:GntR family transcriptional regulator [Pseudomonadota bacterium]